MKHEVRINEKFTVSDSYEAVIHIAKITEQLKLSDRVSDAERLQVFDWFQKNYGDLNQATDTASGITNAIHDGLSGTISPDTIEFLIRIVNSFLTNA